MKRIYLSIMVLACSLGSMAQQEFYIFIQEPSRQPFYVRMGQESHSSSADGHIILSQLKDSVYNLYIGFPRSRDEVLFAITMNRKDHGYELRNVNGRRQLFDLQTLQTASPVASTLSGGQTFRRSDSYSALMAGVVDDSAVLYTSAADTLTSDTALAAAKVDSATIKRATSKSKSKKKKTVEVVRDTVTANKQELARVADMVVAKTDTTKVLDTIADVKPGKPDSVAGVPVVSAQPDSSFRDKRDIIRLSTENIVEGRLMIYVDRSGAVNDTIRIIIPKSL